MNYQNSLNSNLPPNSMNIPYYQIQSSPYTQNQAAPLYVYPPETSNYDLTTIVKYSSGSPMQNRHKRIVSLSSLPEGSSFNSSLFSIMALKKKKLQESIIEKNKSIEESKNKKKLKNSFFDMVVAAKSNQKEEEMKRKEKNLEEREANVRRREEEVQKKEEEVETKMQEAMEMIGQIDPALLTPIFPEYLKAKLF